MTPSPADAPTPIDPNNPFTRDLLRGLTAAIRAQPDETEAEYAERFAAVTTAWAAFHPRDPMEQMLAAQIVVAHHAALDCLNRAAETEDPAQADRHRRSYATMTRTMRDLMRLLERQQQQRPAASALPPPSIEPIPPPRRRLPEPKATHYPMSSQKAPTAEQPTKDPAKMNDEELAAALTDMRAQCAMALFDTKHPMHREALRMLPEILPGIVVPDAWLDDAPAMAT